MRRVALAVVLASALVLAAYVGSGEAAMPALWKNCTNVNKKYPHGVGLANARDRTKGRTPPVTTFKRSDKLYKTAMSHNKRLDADRDGVACEKA